MQRLPKGCQSSLILLLCSDNLPQLNTSSASKMPWDPTAAQLSEPQQLCPHFGRVSLLSHGGFLSRQKDVWDTRFARLCSSALFCFGCQNSTQVMFPMDFTPPAPLPWFLSGWCSLLFLTTAPISTCATHSQLQWTNSLTIKTLQCLRFFYIYKILLFPSSSPTVRSGVGWLFLAWFFFSWLQSVLCNRKEMAGKLCDPHEIRRKAAVPLP